MAIGWLLSVWQKQRRRWRTTRSRWNYGHCKALMAWEPVPRIPSSFFHWNWRMPCGKSKPINHPHHHRHGQIDRHAQTSHLSQIDQIDRHAQAHRPGRIAILQLDKCESRRQRADGRRERLTTSILSLSACPNTTWKVSSP